MEKDVSAYLVKLRRHHPFLATLSLHMTYKFTEQTVQFDTDGRVTRINPNYFRQLSAEYRVGTLLHVTLHSALLHHTRRGTRISDIWNIAADIVVNQIIVDSKLSPPPNTAKEPRYADLSVEQIYTKLLDSAQRIRQGRSAPTGGPQNGTIAATSCSTLPTAGKPDPVQNEKQEQVSVLQSLYPITNDIRPPEQQTESGCRSKTVALDTYWKRAITKAQTIDRMSQKSQGELPAGLIRAIDDALNPQLDWRTILWRFMSRTPYDFSDFDRRFIHQGLYLDQLESESLNVHIAIDTSGSISDRELVQFRSEVESIARCYVNTQAMLYYVDAAVYGPYTLDQTTSISRVEGGGGTDFSDFFEQLEKTNNRFEQGLCIYLTDGYGTFPKKAPWLPVLWVVSNEGGDYFPFGEVTRLHA